MSEENMAEKGCWNCRWWTEDQHSKYIGGSRYSHGECIRIHIGHAAEEQARLYPIGGASWLHTHRDFHCKLHEGR